MWLYPALWQKLKSYTRWWHYLDSTWVIAANLTPTQLRDELSPLIDGNDELLVVDITGDAAAWIGFNTEASKWLKDVL
jgi:hypothetical protein